MRILLLLVTQFIFIANLAIAQEKKNPVRNVKLSFVCVSTLPGQSAIKTFKGDIINLSKRHPSKEVKMKTNANGACNIYLGDEVITPESKPVGEVKIPIDSTEGMVLLIPNQNQTQYKTLFFSNHSFAFGKLSLLNMTNMPIVVKTSDKTIKLRPGTPKVYAPKIDGRAFITPVQMARQKGSDKWRRFYSSTWRIQKSRKELLILYVHPVSKRIRTKAIIEHTRVQR